MKDLRDIADFHDSCCTTIPQHHQHILKCGAVCGVNTAAFSAYVFQYVLNLTSGYFPRYLDSGKPMGEYPHYRGNMLSMFVYLFNYWSYIS